MPNHTTHIEHETQQNEHIFQMRNYLSERLLLIGSISSIVAATAGLYYYFYRRQTPVKREKRNRSHASKERKQELGAFDHSEDIVVKSSLFQDAIWPDIAPSSPPVKLPAADQLFNATVEMYAAMEAIKVKKSIQNQIASGTLPDSLSTKTTVV
jgi:hypothetical protein